MKPSSEEMVSFEVDLDFGLVFVPFPSCENKLTFNDQHARFSN